MTSIQALQRPSRATPLVGRSSSLARWSLVGLLLASSAGCSKPLETPRPDQRATAPHREGMPAPVPNPSLRPGQELCLSVNGIVWGAPIDEARMAGMGLKRRSLQTGESAWTDGRGTLTVLASHNIVVGIAGTQLSTGPTMLGKPGDPLSLVQGKIAKQLERTESSHDSNTQKGVFAGHGACKHGNYFVVLSANNQKMDRVQILTDVAHDASTETPEPSGSANP